MISRSRAQISDAEFKTALRSFAGALAGAAFTFADLELGFSGIDRLEVRAGGKAVYVPFNA